MSRVSRRIAVAAIAVLAALVRLPLLFDRYELSFAPDAGQYLSLAGRLLDGLRFPTDYRSPGYPAFIALAHALPGRVPDMTILLQHALGVGLAAAIVAFGWRWFGPVAGVAAGAVAALSPIVLNVEHDVLPDALFCPIVFAATAVLAAGAVRRPPSYRLLVAAGVLFGLAVYVKPNAQAFLLAGIVPLAVATRSVRRTLVGSAVVGAALVITVSPWIVRNGIEYGHYSMTSQGGDALYLRAFDQDNLPIPTDTPEGRIAQRVRARAAAAATSPQEGIPGAATYTQVASALTRRGMTYAQAVAVEGRLARTAILRHPVEYATGTVRNTVLLWGLSAYPLRAVDHLEAKLTADEFPRPAALALWGLGGLVSLAWFACALGGLAAVAIFVTGTREMRVVAATLAWVWVIVIVGVALFNSPASRFSEQVLPQFLILGAAGAATAARLVRERVTRRPSGAIAEDRAGAGVAR